MLFMLGVLTITIEVCCWTLSVVFIGLTPLVRGLILHILRYDWNDRGSGGSGPYRVRVAVMKIILMR